MKNTLFLLSGICLLLLLGKPAGAQLMMGGQASYLTGNERNLWGGGLQLKVMLGGRLAIGGTLRTYPKNFSEATIGSGSEQATIRSANTITPITGTLEYYMGKGKGIQPYLGVDGGLYFHKLFTQAITNNMVIMNKDNGKTYFGLAPKFGFMFKTGGLFAPFVQAQYHANFGSGDADQITVPGVNAPWESKAVRTFTTFDAGIIIRLRPAGR